MHISEIEAPLSVTAGPAPTTVAAAGGSPPSTPAHLKWLVDTGELLKTADGKIIEVWELHHGQEEKILSAWAKHFRAHYCSDTSIDFLRGQLSRKKYLEDIKFPSRASKLGPSVRAGDFAEILVADFLQWILGYSVPRVRWNSKIVRDESPKGSDVIGFYFEDKKKASPKDALAVFESKASLSGTSPTNRMQDAINDSAKDRIRIDESLNYIKQRLFETGDKDEAQKIERFQNPVDHPYREVHGAAALYSCEDLDTALVCAADTQKTPAKGGTFQPHPNSENLCLIVIKGSEMMTLVHELYRRAADEA
jgi:hypothetical protein